MACSSSPYGSLSHLLLSFFFASSFEAYLPVKHVITQPTIYTNTHQTKQQLLHPLSSSPLSHRDGHRVQHHCCDSGPLRCSGHSPPSTAKCCPLHSPFCRYHISLPLVSPLSLRQQLLPLLSLQKKNSVKPLN